MPPPAVVVVADAHLGADSAAEPDFIAFLARVPSLGSHLVINGDLFDFWFEYRSVIPRAAFPVLAALRRLRDAGTALTITGGNHDRWGGTFFERELGASFYPEGAELMLAGWRTWLVHGDGLSEQHWGGRVLHWATRTRLTVGLFRAIHPDLGFWIARRMSRTVAEGTRDPKALERAAAAQSVFARQRLGARADLDLIVLAHTHRPRLEAVSSRRWYLNPGSWMDDRAYAIITPDGPALHRFSDHPAS
ncbi:MAG TPA: UDP-2,3-diacylglucosamine diphosphatase [Gemmatimonadales bacterium]|jgi:UDP-2,3-diacylglucosamine hydrolase